MLLDSFVGESSLSGDKETMLLLLLIFISFIESKGELWDCLMPPYVRGMLDSRIGIAMD